ncbi:hypothetical protein G0029_16685 (plasmid) [Acinetobacter sp. YH12138]|uniref:hypothetical protein n=1 Tax=unclassified Acinetobacter TaxID=196816 RepID=UPI0015D25C13|nr:MULTISPECIES: hypothetical protein [unclassified Acinetobacter]QOW51430.1 hypothetical protein G0029_16685 [Acinetobacter sp. YH12138]
MNLQTGTNFIGVIAATFGKVADVLNRQLQMKVLQVGESAKLRYLKRLDHENRSLWFIWWCYHFCCFRI